MGHLHGVAGDQNVTPPRPWRRAALWLAFLGSFFFVTYGFANWLAGRRSDVGAIVFAWEHHIPYLPWTLVPYWSIDLFYVASLFVCATHRELDTHARRLLVAQIIAVVCFVLFPLRQTFMRPETTGLYGWMLDALLAFDKPFNQAPALHIALLVVLWVLYEQHLRGILRWLLHTWFVLIGLSVLTTFQHHFIDIPTGLWTGLLCIWLFPDHAKPLLATMSLTRDARRRQLALRYFAGAALFAAAAAYLGGWTLWLWWIAGALLLVALIYACLDAAAFQKDAAGRMPLPVLLLFAPYLIGAWLNSRWWTRHTAPASVVTPRVWIGRLPAHARDLPPGVHALVDLCAELPCRAVPAHYAHIPALDLVPLSARQLADAAQHISRAAADGPVLVCCALGYSRSAAAVAAWLIVSGQAADASEAEARVRTARPQVVFNEAQRAALAQLARQPDRAEKTRTGL